MKRRFAGLQETASAKSPVQGLKPEHFDTHARVLTVSTSQKYGSSWTTMSWI